MAPCSNLSPAEQFFFQHAGFSYAPGRETPEEGRTRGAIALAAAEAVLREAVATDTVSVLWEGEMPEPDVECNTCECASINIGHRPLAVLGAIEDADDAYRRVIEAQLAYECVDELAAAIAAFGAKKA